MLRTASHTDACLTKYGARWHSEWTNNRNNCCGKEQQAPVHSFHIVLSATQLKKYEPKRAGDNILYIHDDERATT